MGGLAVIAACGRTADHRTDETAYRGSGRCVVVIMIAVIAVMPTARCDTNDRRACQTADQRACRRVPAMIVVVGVMAVAVGRVVVGSVPVVWVVVGSVPVGWIAVTIGRVSHVMGITIVTGGRVGLDVRRIGDMVVRVTVAIVARIVGTIAVPVVGISTVAMPMMV